MNEDDRIKEREEELAAERREEITRKEKEEALEAQYQENKELEERNEASMRKIKEDVECLNESLNENINHAVDRLASLSINKRNTVVVNNQRVFTNAPIQQVVQKTQQTDNSIQPDQEEQKTS